MENNMFDYVFMPRLAAAEPTKVPQDKTTTLGASPPVQTAGPVSTPTYKDNPWMDPAFKNVIIQMESQGNPKARGDDKKGPPQAWGLFQQHADYVEQANKALGIWRRGNPLNPLDKPAFDALAKKYKDLPRFTPADRDDPVKAEQIYDVMTQWNVRRFVQKTGRQPNEYELASIHHLANLDDISKVFLDTAYQQKYKETKEEMAKKKK